MNEINVFVSDEGVTVREHGKIETDLIGQRILELASKYEELEES